jgi:hypothetical protein
MIQRSPLSSLHKALLLCPLTQEYGYVLDALALDSETIYRGRFRGSVLTAPPASVTEIWSGIYAHYLVLYGVRKMPLGLVTCYNADTRSGHIHLSAMALPKWQRTGLVAVGAGAVLYRLLSTEPFRKVYLDLASYNVEQMGRSLTDIFELEVSFPGVFYFDGRYWDRLIYSVRRDRFRESPWFEDAASIGWIG